MRFRFIICIIILLLSVHSYARKKKEVKEKDDIQLVVTGVSGNKTEATKNALRSAIEQTYGVFVSTNTELLNDEVIKDEIITISSGNIKSFKEIYTTTLPNGQIEVSLSAIVSIGKLVSYVANHGGSKASIDFDGQSFMMDLKMKELNKKNETLVIKHLVTKLIDIHHYLYDCMLTVGEPRKGKLLGQKTSLEGFYLPIKIIVSNTNNLTTWLNEFQETLSSLSLSGEELKYYKEHNLDISPISFSNHIYYLRNHYHELDINTDWDLSGDLPHPDLFYRHCEDVAGEYSLAICAKILNAWPNRLVITINDGKFDYRILCNNAQFEAVLELFIKNNGGQYDGYVYDSNGSRDGDIYICDLNKKRLINTKYKLFYRDHSFKEFLDDDSRLISIPINLWQFKWDPGYRSYYGTISRDACHIFELNKVFRKEAVKNSFKTAQRRGYTKPLDDYADESYTYSEKWLFSFVFELFISEEDLESTRNISVSWVDN